MIDFTKFLLIGTLFAGATASAFASPLTGTLTIAGTAKASGTTVINFTTNPAASSNGTGALKYFDGPQEILLVTNFTLAGVTPGAGELLFGMTTYGTTVDFYATSYTLSGASYTFLGYITENGSKVNDATLIDTFTTPDGALGTEYVGQFTLTPEPNSIVLLGTGLLAACGVITVKRRRDISAIV